MFLQFIKQTENREQRTGNREQYNNQGHPHTQLQGSYQYGH